MPQKQNKQKKEHNIITALGLIIAKYHTKNNIDDIDITKEIYDIIVQQGYNYDDIIKLSKEEIIKIQKSEIQKSEIHKSEMEKYYKQNKEKKEYKESINKICEDIIDKLLINDELNNFIFS